MVVFELLDRFNASGTLSGVVLVLLVVPSRLTSSQVFSGEAVTILLLSLWRWKYDAWPDKALLFFIILQSISASITFSTVVLSIYEASYPEMYWYIASTLRRCLLELSM